MNRSLPSSQVVSAFIIVSSQPDFEIQSVQFQRRDSINVPFGNLKLGSVNSQAFQKKSKKSHFQPQDKDNGVSDSEKTNSRFQKDRLGHFKNNESLNKLKSSFQNKRDLSKSASKKKNIYQVIDISTEICDLIEQCSLFLGKNELPLTDKNGTLVVLQEIMAKKNKGFGTFNKLVIVDNRLKARIVTKTFGLNGEANEILKFGLGNIRIAYPKTFLAHLLFSNRFIKSLFDNIFN